MITTEIKYQLQQLRMKLESAQCNGCFHTDDCRLDNLLDAKGIVFDLEREIEVQEGEELIAAKTNST